MNIVINKNPHHNALTTLLISNQIDLRIAKKMWGIQCLWHRTPTVKYWLRLPNEWARPKNMTTVKHNSKGNKEVRNSNFYRRLKVQNKIHQIEVATKAVWNNRPPWTANSNSKISNSLKCPQLKDKCWSGS